MPEALTQLTAQYRRMPYDQLLRNRTQSRSGTYSVTWCVHGRQRLLRCPELARAVMNAMGDIADRGYCLSYAFVVMPDHVHWLLSLTGERQLFEVVRATKAIATRSIRRISPGLISKLWQRGFYEHQLRQEREIKTQARYIVANPLRAGLVTRVVDYPWWFAEWAPPPFGSGSDLASATVLID